MRSRLAAMLASLALLATMSSPAAAHQPNDYPFPWVYTITDRVFYIAHPNAWPGGVWNDRDAMRWLLGIV